MSDHYQTFLGDCQEVLLTLPTASVDAIITDPPYPEIDRSYGRLTEVEWWSMMMIVCREARRILKPSGSAVFVLQSNSRKVGSVRGWLWNFMAWVCREWNMVQDIYWWNLVVGPTVHVQRAIGLTRPSLKVCVWAGSDHCFRDQEKIMLPMAEATLTDKRINRHVLEYSPSTLSTRKGRILQTARARGSSTPYNVIVTSNTSNNGAGSVGHSAGTPLELARWWTRYICPPGGVVLDPFMGSGTMGLATLSYGCRFIGIEKEAGPGYYPTAVARLAEASQQLSLY